MRRHDWASSMHAAMADHQGRQFAWGINDCCLFVARTVDAMTGSTLAQQLAAAYSDEASALALIASHGGLAEAVSAFLGPPVAERATRGDVALIEGGEGLAVGICIGSTVVAMGKTGLMSVPRSAILKVWKP